MSPNGQLPGRKVVPANNIFTLLLAVACGLVLAATLVVAYMCYIQYGTIFKIP